MVTISDINKDLDKYIASRREKAQWDFFSSKKTHQPKKVEEVPEMEPGAVHVLEDREPGFWERLFRKEKPVVSEDLSPEEMDRLEAMQEKMEELDELEQEHPESTMIVEEERESLLDKFFGLFRGYGRRHKTEEALEAAAYIEEEVVPQLDEDVKEVLRIIHSWLNRLPKRVRDDFKKSNDFQKYRKLLEKYSLAKK